MALASPTLGAGTWATFPYAFPEGLATTGLDVGALTTQTDVKCRWTDGSIKHAILTVQNPTAGAHDIVEGTDGVSTFTPTYPTASVAFVINGTTYTATLGAFSSLRPWLNGSLVRENRQLVIPVTAEGVEHPLFVVIFDVRMYADGKYKIDVIVRNTKDIAGAANARLYDITIVIDGSTVYTDADETHWWANVWKKTFYSSGFTPATVTFDFEPFYNARALPRFLSTISSSTWTVTGEDFDDPLGFAGMTAYMPLGGGRSEIGFYPWWEAEFLVHQTTNQRTKTLACGDHSGSWSMCVTKADGESLIRLDEFPDYWLNDRATVGHPDGPNVPREGGALRGQRPDPAVPDNQHIPSVSFIPYMVTGDRYYLDQMKFWAAWSIAATYPGDSTVNGIDFGRQQSMGLLIQNGTRGMAWPLRELADVAAYSPDDDTDKNYFVTCLNNNLEWLDAYHAAHSGGISEMPFAERAQPTDDNGYLANAIWQCAYLAYAVDRAIGHGFTAGAAFRDRCIRLQVNFLSHAADGYPQAYGFPYYPRTGKYSNGTSGGTPTLFTTWAQIWGENYDPTYNGGNPYAVRGDLSQPFPNPQPLIGYYDVEAYGLLKMGVRESITGASTALTYLLAQSGALGDIEGRPGFAITFDAADLPPGDGPGSEGTPPAEEEPPPDPIPPGSGGGSASDGIIVNIYKIDAARTTDDEVITVADCDVDDLIVLTISFWHVGLGNFRLDDDLGNFFVQNPRDESGMEFVVSVRGGGSNNGALMIQIPVTVAGDRAITISSTGGGDIYGCSTWHLRGVQSFTDSATDSITAPGDPLSVTATPTVPSFCLAMATDDHPDIVGNLNGDPDWNTNDVYGMTTAKLANVYATGSIPIAVSQLYTQYRVSSTTVAATWTEDTQCNFWCAAVAWFTILPTITDVTPPECATDQPQTLTITGENFPADPIITAEDPEGNFYTLTVVSATSTSIVATGEFPLCGTWCFNVNGSSEFCLQTYQSIYKRRMRIFNLPFNENRWLFLRRFELFLEAGVGLSTGQGDDPQVMISISRDGGKTWGPERWVSAGRIGEYEARAFLHQLGRYRNGAIKIVVSDAVPWNLVAAFGEIEQGLS